MPGTGATKVNKMAVSAPQEVYTLLDVTMWQKINKYANKCIMSGSGKFYE